ncbi:MAG: SurA N-terminal domain-containing protein [Desulfovibrionaceae bacterium]|nr:SurA N-terminal domain-containing protein [Desulfovibrionaceae bacterium]
MKNYIIYILSFIIISCSNQTTPSGIVAVVNGSYITLNELRNRYDIQTMHISEFTTPPIDSLHREYTETLLEMIVELAVEQELNKNKIELSDDMVEQAVQDIQRGYSDEEFSQMLAERYIDFDSWKKQIRAGVIENLYIKHILSNDVSANSGEIQAFYDSNPSLFVVDYKISGLLLTSKDKDVLEKAIEALEKGVSKERVATEFEPLTIEKISADFSNIPFYHIDEVTKIGLKKATAIEERGGIYSAIFVENRVKQSKLSLEEAWNMAQNYVIESKAKALYATAVEGILKRSSIQVVDEFKNAIDEMLGDGIRTSVYSINKAEEKQEVKIPTNLPNENITNGKESTQ